MSNTNDASQQPLSFEDGPRPGSADDNRPEPGAPASMARNVAINLLALGTVATGAVAGLVVGEAWATHPLIGRLGSKVARIAGTSSGAVLGATAGHFMRKMTVSEGRIYLYDEMNGKWVLTDAQEARDYVQFTVEHANALRDRLARDKSALVGTLTDLADRATDLQNQKSELLSENAALRRQIEQLVRQGGDSVRDGEVPPGSTECVGDDSTSTDEPASAPLEAQPDSAMV